MEMNDNEFTGSIPKELGKLSLLKILRLSGNQLSGPLQSELGCLTNLLVMSLSNNHLNGTLPDLGKLTKLKYLYLASNHFSGVIPDSIKALPLVNIENNYFSNQQVPSRWNSRDAFQDYETCPPRIQEKNQLNIEWLSLYDGITPELGRILVEEMNTEQLAHQSLFELAKTPLGLTTPIWTPVHSTMNSISHTMEKAPSLIEKCSETISEMEETLRTLQMKLEEEKSRKSKLEKQLKGWEEYEERYPKLMETCTVIKSIEEELSQSVTSQIESDVVGFSSLKEDTIDKCKLSVLFNGCGLSHDTVTKLSDLNGNDFFINNIEGSYSADDFSSLAEFKDLLYCQHMFRQKCIPYDDHLQDCPICNCDESTIPELLQEYNVDEKTLSLFQSHHINGSRLLMLTVRDLTSAPFNIELETARKLYSSFNLLRETHNQNIQVPDQEGELIDASQPLD